MKSVLQDWVMELPLKQQATLISALRGPDNLNKENTGKDLTRIIRVLVLNPADPYWHSKPNESFFRVPLEETQLIMDSFLHGHDIYPHHFTMHLIHAAEIIGYKCPKEWTTKLIDDNRQSIKALFEFRYLFLGFYCKMAEAFHMTPETEEEMDRRLAI